MNHGGVARTGGGRIQSALVSHNFEVGSNISRLELLS